MLGSVYFFSHFFFQMLVFVVLYLLIVYKVKFQLLMKCCRMVKYPAALAARLILEWCRWRGLASLCFPGEIRCYCDAPHCVATGYMCKSELNACFTKVLDPLNANSPLTHGCLDPIANAADVCSGSTGGSSSSSSRRSDVLAAASAATLDCCHEDMCNYRGLQDLAHTRESAGRGGGRSGTTGCSDIYVSVKVQNSTLSYWLAPRGRNLGFLLDKRSIFLFSHSKKTVCSFAVYGHWAHQRSPFLFFTSPLHTASISQWIGCGPEPEKSAACLFTWSTWKEIRCLLAFYSVCAVSFHCNFPLRWNTSQNEKVWVSVQISAPATIKETKREKQRTESCLTSWLGPSFESSLVY